MKEDKQMAENIVATWRTVSPNISFSAAFALYSNSVLYIAYCFSFGIIIDEHFDENINELVLFPYIFIGEDSEFYDMIVKEKEKIS